MDRRNFLKLLGAMSAVVVAKIVPKEDVPEKAEEKPVIAELEGSYTDLGGQQVTISECGLFDPRDMRGYLDIGGQRIPVKEWSIDCSRGYQTYEGEAGSLLKYVSTKREWSGTATLLFDDPAFLLGCFGQLSVWVENEGGYSGKILITGTTDMGEPLVGFVGSGSLEAAISSEYGLLRGGV